MNKLYINKFSFIALWLYLLVFSDLFITFGLTFFSYLDEITELVCLLILVVLFLKRDIDKEKRQLIVLSAISFFLGIIGNFVSNIQLNFPLIAIDVLATYKGILYFIGFSLLPIKEKHKQQIITSLFGMFFITLLLIFPFSIINLFADIGMSSEIVYGIKGFKFLFANEGNLSLKFYTFVGLWCIKTQKQKSLNCKDKLFIFLALIIFALTLRTRILIFTFVFLLLYLCMFVFHLNIRSWFGIFLLICIGIVLLLGTDKLNYYFGNDNTARYNLLKYGFVTANRYFPFGSGFATYGSDVAADYYSPLYYQYGFTYIYGLSPEYRAFANDGLWGELFGQLGYLGCLVYLIIFAKMFANFFKKRSSLRETFSLLFISIMLLIGSIGTKTLMHFVIVPLFALIGINDRSPLPLKETSSLGGARIWKE